MTELDAFCRTCMCLIISESNNSTVCYNIFKTLNLADNLMRCSKIKVEPSDQYPQLLCGKCYGKVLDCCEFQRMCHDSLNTFKEMLAIETQSIDTMEDETADIDYKQISIEVLEEEDNVSSEGFFDRITHNNTVVEEINNAGKPKKNLAVIDKSCLLENIILNGSAYATEDEQLEKYYTEEDSGDQEEYTIEDHLEDDEEFSLEISCLKNNTEEQVLEDILDDELAEQEAECFTDKEMLSGYNSSSPEPERESDVNHVQSRKEQHQELLDYRCKHENCKRSFSSFNNLQQHLKTHQPIHRNIYICDFNNCGQEYTTKADINNHMRTCHKFELEKDTKRYVCVTCGASLASDRSLRDHLYIHVDRSQWPFVCHVEGCSKRFRTLQEFGVHKRRHAGLKPYVCPYCQKRFFTSSNLSVHVNFHTLAKKWPCTLCSKVCYTPANLRLHMQQKHDHDSANKKCPKRIPCQFCDKTFTSITGRKYHEMLHTGEKPYNCTECGRTFRQPSQLAQHMKTHMEGTREMPKNFHCQSCDRAYTSAQALKYHELKHTGEKPFTCEQCDMKFRFPSSLSRHQKQNLCRKSPKPQVEVYDVNDLENCTDVTQS